jgi:hypothetical protein
VSTVVSRETAMSEPVKAYLVELPATVVKTAIVWAHSVEDAKQRFYGHDDENIEVMENTYYEGKLRRPRRHPQEDREAER